MVSFTSERVQLALFYRAVLSDVVTMSAQSNAIRMNGSLGFVGADEKEVVQKKCHVGGAGKLWLQSTQYSVK